jgi:hypothetical protein
MKPEERKQLIGLLAVYQSESGNQEAGNIIADLKRHSKAGRKKKYSEKTAGVILAMRQRGSSIREISAVTGCSVGYVQKYLKDHEADIHKEED